MPNEQKTFTTSLTHSWPDTVQAFSALAKTAKMIGKIDDEKSFWNLLNKLNGLVQMANNQENDFGFFFYEKNAVILVGADFLNEIGRQVEKIENYSASGRGDLKTSSIVYLGNIENLDLNEETISRWKRIYIALTEEKKEAFKDDLNILIDWGEELKKRVGAVSAVVGFLQLETYSDLEVKNIMEGKMLNFDHHRLYHTYLEAISGNQIDEFYQLNFGYLNGTFFFNDRDLLWEDTLLFSLMIALVFSKFPALEVEAGQFLLRHYLYRAIVSGVPAAQLIDIALQLNKDVPNLKAAFLESVKNNIEPIYTNITKKESKKMNEIFSQYFAGSKKFDSYQLHQFVTDIYQGQENRSFYEEWLRACFHLYNVLK